MANLPFVFGLGFFLRIFVPGLVAAFLIAVFRGQAAAFRGLEGITVLLLLSGLLGLVLRVLYPFVAESLIGTYWPSGVRIRKVKALEKRLREAEQTLKEPPKEVHSREGWRQAQARRYVLLFPIDQFGNRSVAAPTLFANIMASVLSSLALQYGLQFLGSLSFERHTMYVLTRLWFALPREIRQEVSDALAESEALLGSLVAVVLGGIAFLGKGLLLAAAGSWSAARFPFSVAVLLAALAWFLYSAFTRQAIPAAAVYEALFGYVSRTELERVIEESNKAIAAQVQADSKQKGQ